MAGSLSVQMGTENKKKNRIMKVTETENKR